MKLRVIFMAAMAVLLVAAVAGCSKSAEEKLVGTWKLDEAAVKKMMEDAKEKSGKKGAAEGLGTAMIVAMGPKFEFGDDGSMSMTMKNPMKEDAEPETEKGTYEVVGSEGDKLTLKTKLKGEEETVTATFEGDDKLKLEKEGDEMPMVLKRAS